MKSWKDHKSFFWEAAPFFRLLIPLIVAIVCYDRSLIPVIKNWELPLLGGTILLVFVTKFAGYRSHAVKTFKFILLQLAVFVTGWMVCSVNDVRNNEQWFGGSIGNAEGFIARVVDKPVEREKTWKVKVAVTHSIADEHIEKATGEAFVYLFKNGTRPDFRQGDAIFLPNKWSLIRNPGNPYEFDYAKFSNRNNLYYTQFISRDEIRVLESGREGGEFVQRTHDWGMNILEQYVSDSSALGLMQAMLLGDEVNFDDELREIYIRTGIIHIVAISGSHVAVFFLLATGLLFWISKRHQYVKYLIAIPIIWFYVMVAGMPTSAVRAGVMFSLVGLGLAFRRDHNPLNTLFATAFMMLIANPMWLYSIGFQLSFVAVLSLILFYRPIYKLIYVPNPILRKVWQTAAASIAAELLVAPIIIYYFHLLPISFLVANVLAYLFMGVALIGGLLLILWGKIIIIAKPLGALITILILQFNKIIQHLQGFNPVSFEHLHLSFAEMVTVYMIIGGIAAFLLNKYKGGLFMGLSTTGLLLVLLINDKVDALKQCRLVVYNMSGANYVEVIKGEEFIPITADTLVDRKRWQFATKEIHTVSGAWRQGNKESKEVLSLGNKSIVILNKPLRPSAEAGPAFDYVIINYPVREFDGQVLRDVLRFKKLIVGSNQKRYVAERWRDSCLKYDIPAHFTQLDGAYIAP